MVDEEGRTISRGYIMNEEDNNAQVSNDTNTTRRRKGSVFNSVIPSKQTRERAASVTSKNAGIAYDATKKYGTIARKNSIKYGGIAAKNTATLIGYTARSTYSTSKDLMQRFRDRNKEEVQLEVSHDHICKWDTGIEPSRDFVASRGERGYENRLVTQIQGIYYEVATHNKENPNVKGVYGGWYLMKLDSNGKKVDNLDYVLNFNNKTLEFEAVLATERKKTLNRQSVQRGEVASYTSLRLSLAREKHLSRFSTGQQNLELADLVEENDSGNDSDDSAYDSASGQRTPPPAIPTDTVEIICLNGLSKNIEVNVVETDAGEVWEHRAGGQLYNLFCDENTGQAVLHKVDEDGHVDDSVDFEYRNENMALPTSNRRPDTTKKAGNRL